MSRFRTILALAVTAVLWASAFPAIRVGLDGYGVAGLTFLRLAVASAALALAAPLLGVRLPRPRDLPLILLCAASGMAGYQLLLNWGELHVPAGTASLLIATAPVFSVLLAIVFLGERLTTPVVAGSLVAVAGAAVIALAGGDTRFTTAAWIVLAAAVLQGVYHFASKPLLARYTALEVVAYATWVGTALVLPIAPAALRSLATAPPAATAAGVFLGLLPSALGFVVWGYAVARSSVTTATSVLYLVPVIALAVSFAWLGEVPTLAAVIGGAFAVIGVVITRIPPRRPSAVPPFPPGVTMTTSTDLIRRYFDLARHQDADPYLAQFSPDSLLEDEGVEYRGTAAIGAWHRQATPVVYTVHDVINDGDGYDVRVDIAGDFPGSPVPLTHHFTFTDDERIAGLTIRP